MADRQLAVVQSHEVDTFDDKRIKMVRDKFANGAPQDEFDLFIEFCKARNLDPLQRQVYLIPRSSKDANGNWIKAWSIQTSIDGYRAIADRTGAYAGSDEAQFTDSRNKIGDPAKPRPDTATVTVWKMVQGTRCPFTATARWDEYFQDKSPLWSRMPHTMLAKCAESLALRKAFPVQLGGVYTTEEMMQAGDPAPVTPRPTTAATAIDRPIDVVSVGMGTNIDGDDPTYPPIVADRKTGEIIDVTPPATPERKTGYAPRVTNGRPLSEKQFGKIGVECAERGIEDDARHALLAAQFGVSSRNDLTMMQASAFIDWLTKQSPEQLAAAVGEAIRAQAKARGQTEMPMVDEDADEPEPLVSWSVAWRRIRDLGVQTQMQWMELTGQSWPKEDPQAAITLLETAITERDAAIDGTAGADRFTR